MRYYLISDNTDTYTGMRLAGIEGILVHERGEVIAALAKVTEDRNVGVILITEKLSALCSEQVNDILLNRTSPLIVVIPDRHGTARPADSITRYVREAIGIKI